ncbi:MAG TPA: Rne/Rng family ribonuclease [Tepidisphaeraceae bacterium]|jgi:ribonuclease E|nr:Rne/Rng family ribonuclease [Tepidisphaeraceae bacterium]
MAKEMLINVSEGEECRIALMEDGKLEELYMERTSSTSHVGNIYKGKVTNVEPSIQAAFVDFGLGRNGFLHISDLLPSYFGRKGDDVQESVGRKMARRDRPPIQRCLRRGDEIIVQIIKEGIGTKGPTLSTYLSIPGRILVMMPGMASKGVSRKIEDEEERRRLRKILDELKPPKDAGFIIRTAGVGKTKAEIERDLKYLTRLNETISKKQTSPAPVELYTEGDLVTRSVRDVFTNDVEQIIVDNKDVAKKIKEFMKLSAPRTKNKVELYEDAVPLFHKYGIEREIEQMYSRHVPLASGGSLVIDSTEAVVAIDVNSGKFRDHSDAEMTAFKTDMEAADEIARQLKLRDLGGVIICDFIDLRFERHRRQLEERLHENLRRDRAKTKVLRMSQFGIIEMTRQRMRPSLKRSVYFDCPHCKGSGLVKTPESMSLDVMRRLAIALHDQRVARVELSVCSDVAFYMLNRNRAALAQLETETGKILTIKADQSLALDEHKMALFDGRDGLVYMPDLGIVPEVASGQGGRGQQGRGNQNPRRDERNQRHQQPTRGGQQQSGRREDAHEDDEDVEDAVDRREEEQEDSDPVTSGREMDRDEETPPVRSSGAPRQEDRGRQQQGGRQQQMPRRDERGGQQQQRGGGRDNRNQPRDQQRGGQQRPQGQDRFAGDRNRGQDRDRQPNRPQPQQPPARAMDEADVVELDAEGQPSQMSGAGAGSAGQQGFDQQDGGGRKRRRRRRGGRGRGGRGNAGQPLPAGEASDSGDHEIESEVHETHDEDEDRLHDIEQSSRGRDEDHEEMRGRGDDEDNGIAPAPEPMEDVPAKVVEEAPVEVEPAVEEKPKRGRRGTRSRTATAAPRRGRAAAAAQAATEAAEASPVRIPPPPIEAKVVRTGSTDRHQLQTDVPVEPEPVRRPRSYRDLDDIPDDFD